MLIALLLLAAPASQPPLAPLTDSYPTTKGTAGVEFALPGGGAPTVGLTYFLNNDLAARVDFGLDATFSPSGVPAGFSLGVALRFYQAKHDRVGVFLQPSVGFGRDRTAQAEFLSFGGALGIEYFFTNNFSVGGTLGVALNLNNIGAPGSPSVGVELTTGTSGLFASIYF
ncbi:MAG TPA: hypothetical protein VLW85_20005 [Myxococcales bacterium]|nr:hypothetical protein [Myxococcales bacterium]